jgi:hypothetical protein
VNQIVFRQILLYPAKFGGKNLLTSIERTIQWRVVCVTKSKTNSEKNALFAPSEGRAGKEPPLPRKPGTAKTLGGRGAGLLPGRSSRKTGWGHFLLHSVLPRFS